MKLKLSCFIGATFQKSAFPIPPPIPIVAIPYCQLGKFNNLATNVAPLALYGCPVAIAPPH